MEPIALCTECFYWSLADFNIRLKVCFADTYQCLHATLPKRLDYRALNQNQSNVIETEKMKLSFKFEVQTYNDRSLL